MPAGEPAGAHSPACFSPQPKKKKRGTRPSFFGRATRCKSRTGSQIRAKSSISSVGIFVSTYLFLGCWFQAGGFTPYQVKRGPEEGCPGPPSLAVILFWTPSLFDCGRSFLPTTPSTYSKYLPQVGTVRADKYSSTVPPPKARRRRSHFGNYLSFSIIYPLSSILYSLHARGCCRASSEARMLVMMEHTFPPSPTAFPWCMYVPPPLSLSRL